jgi:hypothetical protein
VGRAGFGLGEDAPMTERNDSIAPCSRRSVLKAATLLALEQAIPRAAFSAASAQPLPAKHRVAAVQPASPAWMKDLIVYEIATKGFTSPNGPESGTFNSLRARLSYLQELGITGIWLTGYSLCDPRHFYNIWTQYAVIEPDKFDPALGTAAEFKNLIDDSHQRGIKVFLDVITHGVMQDSPVIKAHPAWFRGGSWGMVDYDWYGKHTDLDDWWVKIYTEFVTNYGVDGYRLDVSIFRPDLWEQIRRNAAAAGHPIVIWEEMNAVIPGVTDFSQRENLIAEPDTGVVNKILLNDLPGFYDRKFGRAGDYSVEIAYQDGTSLKGSTKGVGPLVVRLKGLAGDRVSRRIGESQPDGLPDVKITLEADSRRPMANITVRSDMGEVWQLRSESWDSRPLVVDAPDNSGPLMASSNVDLYIATLSWGSSLQLSCHDNGWAGFPQDKNPYVAQGSRSTFGYSFLFSPMIPIFFAGEEFDATFHALPGLSPNLYGDKDAGKGRWLYGAMLDWSEVKEPGHRELLADVKKMMAIRKQYSKVFAMAPGGRMPNLKAVRHEAKIDVPVPYLRWDDSSILLIAANRSRNEDATLKLKVDLAGTGLGGHKSYLVTDLWSNAATMTLTEAELAGFRCVVKRDGAPGGGIAVFRIHPA